jgi:NADP-dependent 3-hydroxy acid dehydrogenase YdfG
VKSVYEESEATMDSLRNQVVLITGASSGIGAASARAFGQAGARVALAARRADKLEAIAAEIRAQGGEALAVPADVSQLSDIKNLVQQTVQQFGQIDVLFNNAGFGRLDFLDRLDPEADIAAQFAVNVLGVVQTTRQVLPVMMAQKRGHIINMASVAGLVAMPTYAVYAACKFAVRGFSEALRREAAPWGIRVSVIYPGGVATEFGQHARIRRKTGVTTPRWLRLTPEQVAAMVVELARTGRPNATPVIPFLYRLTAWLNLTWPGLVDRLAARNFTARERSDELHAVGLK